MDQPICGHPDNHRPVARSDHVHAPKDYLADTKDHPQVRHVPGKTQEKLQTHIKLYICTIYMHANSC